MQLWQDSAHSLTSLPHAFVNTVITSVPYYGVRHYAGDQTVTWDAITYSPITGLPPITVPAMRCALGNEDTIEGYIGHLVACLRRLYEVLHDTGTLWIVIGDSYANDTKWGGRTGGKHPRHLHGTTGVGRIRRYTGLPPKSLCGIPYRLALAAQADGWIWRQDIIWSKPNPLPQRRTDRFTRSHEVILCFAKKPRGFYLDVESVAEPAQSNEATRLRRSVWTIPVLHRSHQGHSAAFPDNIPEILIPASTPLYVCGSCRTPTRWHPQTEAWRLTCRCKNATLDPAIVLDPFCGTHTTGRVALRLGRAYWGVDISAVYLKEQLVRLDVQLPLFG